MESTVASKGNRLVDNDKERGQGPKGLSKMRCGVGE